MEKGLMYLFLSLCGRLTQVGEGFIGEYCPLCRSGREGFTIRVGGRWVCSECGQEGELWDLLCRLHEPKIAGEILKRYNIKACGALRKEVAEVSRWIEKKGRATRSEVLKLGLKAWQVGIIQRELGDSIRVEEGGGERGVKGQVWVWSEKANNNIRGFDKLIEELEVEQKEESKEVEE